MAHPIVILAHDKNDEAVKKLVDDMKKDEIKVHVLETGKVKFVDILAALAGEYEDDVGDDDEPKENENDDSTEETKKPDDDTKGKADESTDNTEEVTDELPPVEDTVDTTKVKEGKIDFGFGPTRIKIVETKNESYLSTPLVKSDMGKFNFMLGESVISGWETLSKKNTKDVSYYDVNVSTGGKNIHFDTLPLREGKEVVLYLKKV